MSIQFDIEDVLGEVGLEFSIERMGLATEFNSEFLTYTPNTQVTKPFVREHFLETTFKSNTNVLSGDILTFSVGGASYLVMNNTPDYFENEIIRYLAVLYKVNVSVDILRPQNTTVGYDTIFDFSTLYSEQKALMYAPLFGNVGRIDDEAGEYGLDKQELYMPLGYGIKEIDRIQISGTSEYYQVNSVILRRFPNIIIASLKEDTR